MSVTACSRNIIRLLLSDIEGTRLKLKLRHFQWTKRVNPAPALQWREHVAVIIPSEKKQSDWVSLFKQPDFENDKCIYQAESICCDTVGQNDVRTLCVKAVCYEVDLSPFSWTHNRWQQRNIKSKNAQQKTHFCSNSN